MTWPVLAGAPTGAPIEAAMTQPAYKVFSVDPRVATNVPRTVIARASDFTAFAAPTAQLARTHYSRRSPWNADGSLMLLELVTSGDSTVSGGVPLVNGNTLDYIGRVNGFGNADWRWHPTNPDLVIYPSSNTYRAYSINNAASSVFYTFSGYTAVDDPNGMFGDEGTPSRDGRYWVGVGWGNAGPDLVCVDVIGNSVQGTIQCPVGWGRTELQSSPMNWWSMSRKGGYIVTQSLASWTTRNSIAVPAGLNVWSRAGALLRTFTGSGYAFHMDMGTDVDGNEVAVMMGDVGFDAAGKKLRAVRTWRLDGTQGVNATQQTPGGLTRENWHTSCPMNIDGWAFVSSYGGRTSTALMREGSMWNHIYAVRLDGTQRVAVICNVRHPANDSADMTYYYETHAAARPDGTAVAFTSVWDYASSSTRRTSHLYVAKAEDGGVAPPPPPPPPPEPPPQPPASRSTWFARLTSDMNTWNAKAVANVAPTSVRRPRRAKLI